MEESGRSLSQLSIYLSLPAPPASHLSGAAEANLDLVPLDDHRNLAPVVRVLQHLLKPLLVFEDIDVFEGNLAPGEVRTGSRGESSEILTENECLVRRHE